MKYSLRSLMIVVTLAALVMGWWNHRCLCLERADEHWEKCYEFMVKATIIGPHSGRPLEKEGQLKNDALVAKYQRLSDLEGQCANEYRQAIWRPWIRLTMDAPPEVP